ncbi:MAG: hypothetical protein V4487_01205, partial [Chlamydiota bacterium]
GALAQPKTKFSGSCGIEQKGIQPFQIKEKSLFSLSGQMTSTFHGNKCDRQVGKKISNFNHGIDF